MTRPPTETGSRFGIRARLLALLLPCLLGLLALDSWNDYRALRNLMQDSYDRVLLASANALRSSVSVAADHTLQLDAQSTLATARTVLDAITTADQHLYVGLTPHAVATQGQAQETAPARALLGDADLPPPPAIEPTAAVESPVWYDANYRGQAVRVVALRSELIDGQGRHFDLLVQAAQSTAPRDNAEAASLRQQLLRDARMVLVVGLLVWLGVNWSLRPLRRLRDSVVRSEGRVPEPLDAAGVPHEVSPLVSAVNANVASYRELLDAQSQFLADASHQLRTPLAILMTQAGVALREKDPAQLQQTLLAMRAQVARSRRLCEQLLALAQASERATPASAPAIADLNAIARDVVLQHLALAHAKDQDLGWVDARRKVDVHGDSAELYEAMANLVHNAIVHTPAHGRITVAVSADPGDGHAQAEVCVDGPGIAPARREEVFERFRQIDGRTRSTSGSGGAGLGLSIARAFARRNGGNVTLASVDADDTGLRAILRLPAA